MNTEPRFEGDYSARQTAAAHRVLVDLGQVLVSFKECVVVVGGWVPDLLIHDGTDASALAKLTKAIVAEGGKAVLVAPKVGGVKGKGARDSEVQHVVGDVDQNAIGCGASAFEERSHPPRSASATKGRLSGPM